MKEKFKPGELWAKHQEKMKKKHEKHKKTMSANPLQDKGALQNFGRSSFGGGHTTGQNALSTRPTASNSPMKMKKHEKHRKHKKNWIAGAIKHPGALHAELGVKQGHKIPAKTLAKAAKKGGVEGKRARLAETLKGFHHKKHYKKANDHDADDKKMKHEKHEKKHCKTCEC